MQAYGPIFARVYNLRWSGFARQIAPHLLDFGAKLPVAPANRAVLDLCCGTGQLARAFLDQGYRVTGLDLSSSMLDYARENTQPYVESGQAHFVEGDAADFTLDERFGLVVSTFDALNHLTGASALKNCFRCVQGVLDRAGYFIFDLNTRKGLARWNGISVEDTEEAMIVNRGIYDGEGDKAWTLISGFVRRPDGLYERFSESAFNTVFDLAGVKNALLESGWREVHFARLADLAAPLDDPESEGRVWVVARL